MKPEMSAAPFTSAVIQLILAYKRTYNTKWSTTAGHFSAVKQALKNLPMYSTESMSIDMSRDPLWEAAQRQAQQLARITFESGTTTRGITVAEYLTALRKTKSPGARLLIELAWVLADRIGDLRMVAVKDVTRPSASQDGLVAFTHRKGKGARWWGPYTLLGVLTPDVDQRLQDQLAHRRAIAARSAHPEEVHLFSTEDQRAVSAVMKELGVTIRSIRKGALEHLAARGITDNELQVVSNHRRQDTLRRSGFLWHASRPTRSRHLSNSEKSDVSTNNRFGVGAQHGDYHNTRSNGSARLLNPAQT